MASAGSRAGARPHHSSRHATTRIPPGSTRTLARIDRYREADVGEVARLFTECAAEDPTLAPKYKVTDDKCFTGLDAYRQVLDAGIEYTFPASDPVSVESAYRFAAQRQNAS